MLPNKDQQELLEANGTTWESYFTGAAIRCVPLFLIPLVYASFFVLPENLILHNCTVFSLIVYFIMSFANLVKISVIYTAMSLALNLDKVVESIHIESQDRKKLIKHYITNRKLVLGVHRRYNLLKNFRFGLWFTFACNLILTGLLVAGGWLFTAGAFLAIVFMQNYFIVGAIKSAQSMLVSLSPEMLAAWKGEVAPTPHIINIPSQPFSMN